MTDTINNQYRNHRAINIESTICVETNRWDVLIYNDNPLHAGSVLSNPELLGQIVAKGKFNDIRTGCFEILMYGVNTKPAL